MTESARTIVVDNHELVKLPRLLFRKCPVCLGTGREFVHGWSFPRPCDRCQGQKIIVDEPFDMVGAEVPHHEDKDV